MSKEDFKLGGLNKGYQVLILQFKTCRVKSRRESCIRINIRKLDRVLSTKCLPYIHLANSLYYTKPSLF